ncbi:MAG TPA: N-acetylglutaminylglutamine synthetase [Woeseiaceae bacterium]|nr:N-acetylglutaminylglutamine synthetase [Woeseiaceae bacterium]
MKADKIRHRVERQGAPTLRNWDSPKRVKGKPLANEATVDCGWGRLIFAHTFDENRRLADAICDEKPEQRNIALYIKDPHVVLALKPHELFLDPSHTYRLWLHTYRASRVLPRGFRVRRAQGDADANAIGHLLASRNMVPPGADFILSQITSKVLTHFVAEDERTGEIIGTVMGVDHFRAFNDVENGSSLWALAVDPQAPHPGIGRALTASLADHFAARGLDYMDLSVMHNNAAVISLYEKMGFQRVPVFCIKKKNAINEPLYSGSEASDDELNPYARIIVDEARRRGIAVDLVDAGRGYFELAFGARTIACRESLTDMTSAVAMSRCDDKRMSQQLLRRAGVAVPDSRLAADDDANQAFLQEHGQLVVKPVRGEQGNGVSVGISDADELRSAVGLARRYDDEVMLEEFVAGQDLRIIVIDGEVVAAAVRRPASITGNGTDTVVTLIEKQSRRRAAATDGESRIPVDAETGRCLAKAGLTMESVPEAGRVIQVRDTANLHTGGTLHDVTESLHPELAAAAVRAATALDIPVVGLDLIVAAPDQPGYRLIEANERPGLANHEPQPTAERFIDYLFPQTAA